MERAAAVIVGGIGLVLLTLAAVVSSLPGTLDRTAGVDLAVVVTLPAGSGQRLSGAPGPRADRQATPATTAAVTPTGDADRAADGAPAPRPAAAPGPSAELAGLIRQISTGGIRFAVNRADLDPSAQQLLDRLAALLVAEPDVVLVVRGHTDSTGTDAINGPLSQRRAAAVCDYLVARGVAASRLVAEGVGPAEPVADNSTEQGRQANRRSDIAVERTP